MTPILHDLFFMTSYRLTYFFLQVTLTLMGEGAGVPWRLLDIEILVKDHETGGKAEFRTSYLISYAKS